MSLEQLVDNTKTDKNTVHSYLPLYQALLERKKETAKNVLEVGIFYGGSIRLWKDFFTSATVHGVDIVTKEEAHARFTPPVPIEEVWTNIENEDRIVLHTSCNAYDEDFFKERFLDLGLKFDFVLDDGPNSLDSMKAFIRLYSQLLTDDGILIIEDVQFWPWIDLLKEVVPEHLKPFIKTYDLRRIKNRYDDIVFTIDKSSATL